eukprot:TRINITY_DN705_c0_g2_i5.p1 TRINITY_DN705_c0_g2~~TRINITY_DN705_c0_g2_i5.p1  ORF type:complete len:778 (-),score=133.06 TRINITY_DN705_c0_g2_i5:76-2409(-)
MFMTITRFDDQQQILFYEAGMCSLDEINKIFAENNIYWFNMEPELRRIIFEISDIFIKFLQNGVYHSDLKPANIVFYVKPGKLSKHIKLIDFGCCTENFKELQGSTLAFYQPSKYTFNTVEERETAELYSLGRTILITAMSSIIDNMCDTYIQVNSISDPQEIQEYQDMLRQKYLENDQPSILLSLEQIKEYYSEDIYNICKNLLIDKLPLKDYLPIFQEMNKNAKSLNTKQSLFIEIDKRKLKKRSQKLLFEDHVRIEDVLQECEDLEQYDLGQSIMEELTKQQILKHPIFSYHYANFLFQKQQIYELKQFIQEVNDKHLYREYKETSYEWYLKCLLFADSQYEGEIKKQLEIINKAIAEVENYYHDNNNTLRALLLMRKADAIRCVCQGEYYEEQKSSINEALRIFTLKKDENLQNKLLYYRVLVVIASIERVSYGEPLVTNDPLKYLQDAQKEMIENKLENFNVYCFLLYILGILIHEKLQSSDKIKQTFKTLKMSISIQPSNFARIARSYSFLSDYKSQQNQIQKALEYSQKSATISAQIFGLNYYFTEQSMGRFQSLEYQNYPDNKSCGFKLLFPKIYSYLDDNNYQMVYLYLDIATYRVQYSNSPLKVFFTSMKNIYKDYQKSKTNQEQNKVQQQINLIIDNLKKLRKSDISKYKEYLNYIDYEINRFSNQLSKAYADENKLDEAILILKKQIHNQDIVNEQSLINLKLQAILYKNQGNIQLAFICIEKALELSIQINKKWRIAELKYFQKCCYSEQSKSQQLQSLSLIHI